MHDQNKDVESYIMQELVDLLELLWIAVKYSSIG